MSQLARLQHNAITAQGVLHDEDDDHEEEFEIDINEAEPEFLKGQSSRSGVEVKPELSH